MKNTIAAMALSLAAWSGLAQAQDYKIEHLEPPSWWVGMQDKSLQLLVHGPGIADLEPSLAYPGVQLQSVTRVPNKNYLFLNLDIGAETVPGKLVLQFKRGSKRLSVNYELQARTPGSAQRKSFSTADVVLNFMPDRFANGDPGNDSVPRLLEKVDRKDPSGRHGGDLKGVLDHLDYLAQLGYTALWATPLLESNQAKYSYHGYATTDHYRIDDRYGSNQDYRALSAAARSKGMGLVHDVVLSHIGSGHWWMKDLPTKDWVNHEGKFVATKHFRVAVQDPYASVEDAENFTTGWFEPNMPDLNQRNPLVANYLTQNAIWWIEYADLYGIRVDTYGYSDTRFLSDWARRVMAEYPNLTMVGEEWSNSPNVVAHWQRGKVNFDGHVGYMPGMIDFPVHNAIRAALASKAESWNGGLIALYEMLAHDHLYADPRRLMLFEGNHDVPRTFSVLDEDPDLYRMAMTLLLTLPRIPQIYYGSEVLMTSTKHRDDAAARQDFPGGWAGDKVNAFTGVGLSAQQKEAQAFLKKLMNWRKAQSVIHHGKLMHFGPENGTYVYFRYDDTKKVMVILNKNKKDTPLAVSRFREMLAGVRTGVDVIGGKSYAMEKDLMLPAGATLVLELDAKAAR